MKILSIIITMVLGCSLFAQVSPQGSINLNALDGSRISSDELFPEGETTVIVFWSLKNHQSIALVQELDDMLGEVPEREDLNIIAVCVDEDGKYSDVRPFVNGYGLSMDIYVDINNETKRALGVPSVPYVIYCNKKPGKHCSYSSFASNADVLMNVVYDNEPADGNQESAYINSKVH